MKQVSETFGARTAELEAVTAACKAIGDAAETGYAIRDKLLPAMDALRVCCDQAETLTPKTDWPFPTYDDLLFGV